MPPTLSLVAARAHWIHAAGLAADGTGVPEAARSWVRTLGGADAWFAIRSRFPALGRGVLSEAVRSGGIRVVTGPRGCIYAVPATDAPLLVRFADDLARERRRREMEQAGLPAAEVTAVGAAILGTLAPRPLTTDGLRKALPPGIVRSLGEAGRKVGLSSNLPPVLRDLEGAGRVLRVPEEGRLDHERYLWHVAPADFFDAVPATADDRRIEVARRFLAFAGPVSLAEAADFLGGPQRDWRVAFDAVGAEPVAVEGRKAAHFRLPESASPESGPPPDRVSFLAFEDPLAVIHGGPAAFVDPRFHGLAARSWGPGPATTLGAARHLATRCVLRGDRLVAFWEYDAPAGSVVVAPFDADDRATRAALREPAAALARFIAEEIGHARSFSLETDEDVQARVFALRSVGTAMGTGDR